MVMEAVHEDIAAAADDGTIHCTNHPYQSSSPGGICAFCLQEKLGKLVSSSFPSSIFPSSSTSPSSSASPSFRSDFLLPSKLKPPLVLSTNNKNISFNRSKSTAANRFNYATQDYATPRRRNLWSFLHKKNKYKDLHFPSATSSLKRGDEEDDDIIITSPNEATSFEGKVSRSRSVGCGSRSFSFGDCTTLRRVESQREGNNNTGNKMIMNDCTNISSIKERVKCGGIFSGFMITSSSSVHSSISGHGRSKSWGWALASPMRAFSKPSSVKKGENSKRNIGTTPDLNAIPSLLSV